MPNNYEKKYKRLLKKHEKLLKKYEEFKEKHGGRNELLHFYKEWAEELSAREAGVKEHNFYTSINNNKEYF